MDAEDIRAENEGEEEELDPGQDEEQKYPNLDTKKRDLVKEKFHIFDSNNNQWIEVQQLGTLLRWLSFNPTEQEMSDYVQKYDSASRNQITLD